MTDTIIKGTGNSRSIRSVPNLAALAPTYDKLLELLTSEDGLPVDLGPLNLAGLLQKGDDINKATLLTDSMAALLGLDNTAVPNDALMALYASSKGMAQIRVTVHDAAGHPFGNIPVTGLTDVMGNTPVFTNANGVAVGYSMAGSKTFSTKNILDITEVSKSQSVSAGGVYNIELVPARRNFALFENSAQVFITDSVETVDVSAVSGGGKGENGSYNPNSSGYYVSGKGGNTGTSTISYNIDVEEYANSFVSMTVGGTNGGTSEFLGVEAKVSTTGGGAPASTQRASSPGNAGNPVDYQYFTSFTEMGPCGGNGGSGAASYDVNGVPGGNGSNPFGGSGGDSVSLNGISGKGPGGAGGGAASRNTVTSMNGGTGHKGVVTVRIHFKGGITA